MAKTEKKISIALFDKIMKEHYQNERTIEWHDAVVRVKPTLSLSEMLAFVDDAAGSCFHDRMGFMPEVMDFVIKSNILTRYANFSMPDDLEHRYQMIYGTDIVDTVCGAVNTAQLDEIIKAVNSKIRFQCDSKADLIQERVGAVLDAMEKMRDSTKEIFDGITHDDLKAIMSAVTSHGMDEQKIVQAYMEQKKAERLTGEPSGGHDGSITTDNNTDEY